MTPEPTPGPWIVGTILANNSEITEDALAIWPATITESSIEFGQPVCLISPMSQLGDTDLMNAQLIAAAPDLLKALQRAHAILKMNSEYGDSKTYATIEDALTKATRPLPSPSMAPASVTSPVTLTFSSGSYPPSVASNSTCPWCGDKSEPIETGGWPECGNCSGN